MKQLGSTVDDVLGDDDDKPAGRRGSKEKKCTPLKEKLHKSWGGRVGIVPNNPNLGMALNSNRSDLYLNDDAKATIIESAFLTGLHGAARHRHGSIRPPATTGSGPGGGRLQTHVLEGAGGGIVGGGR